ncbi:BTB domain-containing protein [Mycena sanguinolenta]|uniref:BTB domain-containing protein n=1 Tax=Mycena sanguinolenta TaxID=230812 RepID=A0A8H6Y499_9AGAR|nr:BTB domain-containing protein [Mycena sanguinolenta]
MSHGDIILQAESTQFRVNSDVLAQQSSVFKNMFALSLLANDPAVEVCPIVHVSGTAKDWELLFGVFYQPFSSSASRPLDVVASMLRLGRKYDIPAARDDALSRLRAEFPAEYQVWNKRDEFLTTIDDHAPFTSIS